MPIFKKFLRQIGADMGGEPKRKDLRRARNPGQVAAGGYHRVPSHGTISASTTSTSLVTEYETQNQKNFNLEYPVEEEDYSNSPDEEEDFETTRLHFQKHKQISIDSIRKPKMEMSVRNSNKDENLRNTVPFVKQLSAENVKKDFSINGDGTVYSETTQKINYISQLCAAIAVSLGSMVCGYTTAYTSPALVTLKNDLKITDNEGSWVGGLMPFAALLGGISGGWLIERVGRRNTILSVAVPFIASWIVIAQAPNVYVIYVGRALGGLCVGIGSLAFPVYLGEVLQPELRGQLGLLPTVLGNIGMLVCYTAGKYLDWVYLAYLGAFLPVAFLFLVMLIPETPRWYVSKRNSKGARDALQWLRGKKANVNGELEEITKMHQESETNDASVLDLFKREYLPAVLISLGLMFFQQMSGINALMFYTVDIFRSAGSTIDENLCTIIIGIVNFAATFVATFLIDRLGRKKLLYISGTSMILTLAILGSFFYVRYLKMDVSEYGWLPLASCVIYVIGFSLGYGPIPWLMMGEILPAKIRGTAASLVTAFNWTCAFGVTKTFTNLKELIGAHGTFWLFGVSCIFGLFFTIFYVPETRGKSLEEIEKKLSRKR